MTSAPESVPHRSSRAVRRRPLLVLLAVALVVLLGLGVAAAVYLAGLARSVDQQTQRFEGGAFPEESLRPVEPGAAPAAGESTTSGEAGTSGGTAAGNAGPGVWTPTAPPPGMDPSVAAGRPQGPQAPSPDERADGAAVDVLLVGSDTGLWGRDPAARSDSMMWVHVPGDRSRVDVISVMRDFWVPVPGHGDHKVNAAYQYGGIPLMVTTVENMFQARVDHVVAVDMAGFEKLVDALGGVTVDNPTAFEAQQSTGMSFPQGRIDMDGAQALAYARERYAFKDGDFHRVENQQRLVKAILSKLASTDTLANPGRVQDAVARFSPYVTMDDSLDAAGLAALAWSLRGAADAPIVTSTAPNLGVGRAGDQSVIWPDWSGIRAVGKGIRTSSLADAVG